MTSSITAEAFAFYTALSAANTKEFWMAHKSDYDQCVREPMAELGRHLEPGFGPVSLFRPYRDVRFSRDKTPYKDHQGMVAEYRNGLAWYLQGSAAGVMVGGGWYRSTPSQVARYRDHVDADDSGTLESLIDDLQAKGYLVDGERLKTRPRGCPADHPRLPLLRHTTLHATRGWSVDDWPARPDQPAAIRSAWSDFRPLMAFLADVVGAPDAIR